MCSIKRFLITSSLVSLFAPTASAQTDFDALDVKPVIMLLVDTSGSMERMPGTSALPDCASTDNALKKNRWAVTLEALTGTFDTYSCVEQNRASSAQGYTADDYDYGYHLAHYEFVDPDLDGVRALQTSDDGLLDVFKNRAKFGVMTFDGVGTLLGGDPLLDDGRWNAALADPDGIEGVGGMYSYGDRKELVFPGCETVYYVNSGARRPNEGTENIPGALISPGASDALADMLTVNQKAQNSLLAVRPFGGTPTAAMLDDLNYWLENSDDIRPTTSTMAGDDFYSCRDRYAVLITDGAPDKLFRDDRYDCDIGKVLSANADSNSTSACPDVPGGCRCPYDLETTIVQNELIASDKLKKLFVVAFDVDTATQIELDAIAVAGGTERAYSASNATALRNVLDNLMKSVTRNSATRTSPVTVSSGTSFLTGGKQFELKAGYRKGETSDDPYEGILERQRVLCKFESGKDPSVEAVEIDEGEGDRFQVVLNSQQPNDRRIITVPGISSGDARGSLIAGTGLLSDLSRTAGGTGLGLVTLDVDPLRVFPDMLDPSAFGATSTELDGITAFLNGSSRLDSKLSDIVHSTPAVLPALELRSSNSYVNAFRRSLITDPSTYRQGRVPSVTSSDYSETMGRPAVVFVGTNDGVLHAFNLDTWSNKNGVTRGAGYEFWGFVPPALFSKLKSAATPNHEDMFDGPPIVRDMILRQDRTTQGAVPEMATILLAPIRGAAAYVALDVTLPDRDPIFLWQISDERMGNTIAAPALAQVDVEINTKVERRGVAILPGGEGTTNSSSPATTAWTDDPNGEFNQTPQNTDRTKGRDWSDKGRVLLVIDVATGAELRRFTHFPAPLTGSVTIENIRADTSEHAYFTDADGVLWRLDMTNTDADKWRVVPVWDVFAGEAFDAGSPSSFIPIITRDTAGNTVILLGTGSLDNTTDANAQNFVVSLKESNRRVESEIFRADVAANWVLPLSAGELVTGQLSLLDGVVYFGSFAVGSTGALDKCAGGESRLWGVDYLEVDEDGLPSGRLEDGSSLVRFTNPTENDDDPDNDGKLVLGVSITRTPICVEGTIENNAVTGSRFVQQGATGGGTFTVRGMVSGGSSSSSASGGSIGQFERTLSVQKTTRVVGFAGSIE